MGYATSGFLQKFYLPPPLLLDHIDQSRSVCVSERVCVFLCASIVKSVVMEVGHVILTPATSVRGSRAEL